MVVEKLTESKDDEPQMVQEKNEMIKTAESLEIKISEKVASSPTITKTSEKTCSNETNLLDEDDDDKFSSEDDLPLVKLQPKKPNETVKKSDEEKVMEVEEVKAKPKATVIRPRRSTRLSESKTDEAETEPNIKAPKENEPKTNQDKDEKKIEAIKEVEESKAANEDEVKSEKSDDAFKKSRKSGVKEKTIKQVTVPRKISSEDEKLKDEKNIDKEEENVLSDSKNEKKISASLLNLRRNSVKPGTAKTMNNQAPSPVDVKQITSSSELISIKSEPLLISTISNSVPNVEVDVKTEDQNDSNRNKCIQDSSAPLSSLSVSSIHSNNSSSSSKQSDDEKYHRAWKKSIMMVLNNISCHK